MYNFIDVNEASEGYILPSEALKINGVYIEDQISGYRTLSVTGREALSPEVVTQRIGIRDGSIVKSKQFPERIITVRYQLIAESNEAFRESYNKLGGILNVTDAELIFNDEQDKFFTGTPCGIEAVEPGRNTVVGEFEILCADPFKYSVVEYEAEADSEENSILIDYNGTYKAFPKLEAAFYNETEVGEDGETAGSLTGNGDCGYVAFFTEDEKIVQLGDPDEVDTEGNYAKSQTLINQTFMGSTAWGTTAKNLWAVNSGNLQSNTVQVGSVAMAPASYGADATGATTGTVLENAKSDYGSPYIYYTVKAKVTERSTTTAKVVFTIECRLATTESYFGAGYGLWAEVYTGSAWKGVTLKKTSAKWSGTTVYTATRTVNIHGLTKTQTAITGLQFKVSRTDELGQAGILRAKACNDLAILAYGETDDGSYFLTANSYGTDSAHWHGPSITRQIGADAAGEVGAKNFTLTYRQKMCMGNASGNTNQMGGFQMHIVDASGKNICGIRVYKATVGKTGKLVFYVNGSIYNTTDIDLYYNNYYFGASVDSVQTTTITKSGSTITFAVGGYKRQFTVAALKDVAARKVTFSFEQYPGHPFLSYNGLYWAKFVKNNCDTYKDIPNKFSANDVLEADCKNGEIRLNGVLSPDLGALGNDWEGFYLTPGLNQIGFAFSSWVAAGCEPAMKVRYREVFL